MSDAAELNFTKNEIPGLWEPAKAITFFDLANKIDVHLRQGLPVTREVMLVICFHETGFSNIKQGRGSGPAVGFGQMEIFNKDKIPFFATRGFDSRKDKSEPIPQKGTGPNCAPKPVLIPLQPQIFLDDDDLAIQLHCEWFEWLFDCAGMWTLSGMLSAQTGGGRNAVFVDIFRESAKQLKQVINSGDRKKVIDALNSVQFQFNKGGVLVNQSFKLDRFKKYWDFTLPEDDMVLGLRR
jgi:hypothetical protein